MKVMLQVHPSKGYLNSQFRLFTNANPGELANIYSINSDNQFDDEPCEQIVISDLGFTPHQFNKPGKYLIVVGTGSCTITVEDGIKLGGSRYKDSYVFSEHNCSIVVMKDRMYFHDNETKQEFLEYMSPDDILSLPYNNLLFVSCGTGTNNYQEYSLYNIASHKTICYFLNYQLVADRFLVCISGEKGSYRLDVFDLAHFGNDEHLYRLEIKCEDYYVDTTIGGICYYSEGFLYKKRLEDLEVEEYSVKVTKLDSILDESHFVRTYNDSMDVNEINEGISKLLFDLSFGGRLFFDIDLYRQEILNEKEKLSSLLENVSKDDRTYIRLIETINHVHMANFANEYYSLVNTTTLSSGRYKVDQTHSTLLYLNGVELELSIALDHCSSIKASKSYVLLSVGNKIFVIGNGCVKHEYVGKLQDVDFGIIIARQESGVDSFITLDGHGDVKSVVRGKFLTTYLKDFYVLEDKNTHECYVFNETNNSFEMAGIVKHQLTKTPQVLKLENGFVGRHGVVCHVSDAPASTSKDTILAFGKVYDSKQDYLYKNETGYWLEPNTQQGDNYQLFADIMDTSSYQNVLLSSDGNMVLYRNGEKMVLKNPLSGESTPFDDVRFISHINGNRPLFRVENSHRRIRIIDPVTNDEVNNDYIVNYNFVSPDGKYYASTKLSEYTWFYDKIRNCRISRKEWNMLVDLYDNPRYYDGAAKAEERKKNRARFINENRRFFEGLSHFDEKKMIEGCVLTRSFIEVHAVCKIFKMHTDELIEEIELGNTELGFLNYVSFSYDSRYVAIAGCYPWGCGGGLFVVFDLHKHKHIVMTSPWKAVWHTAFTQDGLVAAYDSNPNTYIVRSLKEEDTTEECRSLPTINGENFMAFSPDGKYMALSNQGYLPYDKRVDDDTWGHMPSTKVIVRRVDEGNEKLVTYNDLSDEGIQGTNEKVTAASVSFSSDNQRLMMVGKDGTIVIRNTHLEKPCNDFGVEIINGVPYKVVATY